MSTEAWCSPFVVPYQSRRSGAEGSKGPVEIGVDRQRCRARTVCVRVIPGYQLRWGALRAGRCSRVGVGATIGDEGRCLVGRGGWLAVAGTGVVGAVALGVWAWFLAGQTLEVMDKWSSVLVSFLTLASLAVGIIGLIVTWRGGGEGKSTGNRSFRAEECPRGTGHLRRPQLDH